MTAGAPRIAAAGACLAAVAIAAGAFGAHGLAERLGDPGLELWETAARYLLYGAFGTLVAGLVGARSAGLVLIGGAVVFASAVGGLALGAPRMLGAVAPIGGLGLIVGFVLLSLAVGGHKSI